MIKSKLIIALVILCMGHYKSIGQERKCEYKVEQDTIFHIAPYKTSKNLVLFYRKNKISVRIPRKEIYAWKTRLSMTDKEIAQRIEFIEKNKIESDTTDFSFANIAGYITRVVLKKGRGNVTFNNKLAKSFHSIFYKSENCLQYIRFEFEPNIYFEESVIF